MDLDDEEKESVGKENKKSGEGFGFASRLKAKMKKAKEIALTMKNLFDLIKTIGTQCSDLVDSVTEIVNLISTDSVPIQKLKELVEKLNKSIAKVKETSKEINEALNELKSIISNDEDGGADDKSKTGRVVAKVANLIEDITNILEQCLKVAHQADLIVKKGGIGNIDEQKEVIVEIFKEIKNRALHIKNTLKDIISIIKGKEDDGDRETTDQAEEEKGSDGKENKKSGKGFGLASSLKEKTKNAKKITITMKKLFDLIKSLGPQCSDLVDNVTEIVNLLNTDSVPIQKLKELVGKLNKSIAKGKEASKEINEALNELKRIIVNDDEHGEADGKSKTGRVVPKVANLIEDITNILEQCLEVAHQADLIVKKGGIGEIAKQKEVIVEIFKEIKNRALRIKDTLKDITNIIKGKDDDGERETTDQAEGEKGSDSKKTKKSGKGFGFISSFKAKMKKAKDIALTMKKLFGSIKTLGTQCSDLVDSVTEIVNLLNTDSVPIQELKELVEKLNESIAKGKETSKEINEALNELKSIIVNDDEHGEADGKSKTGRVVAKVANLIEDITNILEQCLKVANQADLIVKNGGIGNIDEQKEVIVEIFKEIKNRALHIKNTLKDIINIIKGKEEDGDRETTDQAEEENGSDGKENKNRGEGFGLASSLKEKTKYAKKITITMKKLFNLIKSLGPQCSDLVDSVTEIVNLFNTDSVPIQELKELVEKLNESIAKGKETSKEINEALNELKRIIGNDDEHGEADVKSKTGRVVAKVANLMEDITNILEQCLEVAHQADLIVKKGAIGENAKQKEVIVEIFKEIKNRARHIKDTLKDIISIIKEEDDGERETTDQVEEEKGSDGKENKKSGKGIGLASSHKEKTKYAKKITITMKKLFNLIKSLGPQCSDLVDSVTEIVNLLNTDSVPIQELRKLVGKLNKSSAKVKETSKEIYKAHNELKSIISNDEDEEADGKSKTGRVVVKAANLIEDITNILEQCLEVDHQADLIIKKGAKENVAEQKEVIVEIFKEIKKRALHIKDTLKGIISIINGTEDDGNEETKDQAEEEMRDDGKENKKSGKGFGLTSSLEEKTKNAKKIAITMKKLFDLIKSLGPQCSDLVNNVTEIVNLLNTDSVPIQELKELVEKLNESIAKGKGASKEINEALNELKRIIVNDDEHGEADGKSKTGRVVAKVANLIEDITNILEQCLEVDHQADLIVKKGGIGEIAKQKEVIVEIFKEIKNRALHIKNTLKDIISIIKEEDDGERETTDQVEEEKGSDGKKTKKSGKGFGFISSFKAKMKKAKDIALTMNKLFGSIKTLGTQCSDLVDSVTEIVNLLNTDSVPIQELKELVGKLNESIAKGKETSKEINEALNELKSIIVNDDEHGEADGKSKTGRVVAKVANLIEDITNILEQCLKVANQADLIVKNGGIGEIAKQKEVIVEIFKEIKNRALHIKNTLKDIINIIKGKEEDDNRETTDQVEEEKGSDSKENKKSGKGIGLASSLKGKTKNAKKITITMKKLFDLIKSLGPQCSDLVDSITEIVNLLNTDSVPIQELKELVGKLNKSIAKGKETSKEINEALNELKSIIVNDDEHGEADGKSKTGRVVAKVASLIEDITNIFEQCLEVDHQADLIVKKGGIGENAKQKEVIVEIFKEIKNRARHIKDTLKDIISIIKEEEDDGDRETTDQVEEEKRSDGKDNKKSGKGFGFSSSHKAKMKKAKEIDLTMKKIIDLMKTIGTKCSDLVDSVTEIVNLLNTDSVPIQELRKLVGKLNKSTAKVKETSKEIYKAHNELKSIISNDEDEEADGKSKTGRVVAKAANLIEDITNILEQCLEVAHQADLIIKKGAKENISEQKKVIIEIFKEIKNRALHIKDTLKDILRIIKEEEDGVDEETTDQAEEEKRSDGKDNKKSGKGFGFSSSHKAKMKKAKEKALTMKNHCDTIKTLGAQCSDLVDSITEIVNFTSTDSVSIQELKELIENLNGSIAKVKETSKEINEALNELKSIISNDGDGEAPIPKQLKVYPNHH